jgi:hypothetical protein
MDDPTLLNRLWRIEDQLEVLFRGRPTCHVTARGRTCPRASVSWH